MAPYLLEPSYFGSLSSTRFEEILGVFTFERFKAYLSAFDRAVSKPERPRKGPESLPELVHDAGLDRGLLALQSQTNFQGHHATNLYVAVGLSHWSQDVGNLCRDP